MVSGHPKGRNTFIPIQVALRNQRVGNRPPELEGGIVPKEGELALPVVIGVLFVMEDRLLGEDDMAVAELRRNQDLVAIMIGKGEADPWRYWGLAGSLLTTSK